MNGPGNVIYFPVCEPLLLAEIQSMLQGSLRGLSSNFGVTTQYVLRLLKSTELCSIDSMRVATKKSLLCLEMQEEQQGNRKDCPTSSSLPDNIPKSLHDACSSAIDLAATLFEGMHKRLKVFSEVRDKHHEGPPPPSQLYSIFVSPILSWIRRDEHFEHICLNHGFFEGNFVRALQRMVNLFNELLVAFEITNQPEWVNCVPRAREDFIYGILLVDSIYV